MKADDGRPDFGGLDKLPSWFARIPTAAVMDLKITPGQLRVLAVICCYANNQGFAWPNRKTIFERSGLSDHTFQKAMRKLKARGHIQIVSRHRSHPKWRHVMGNVYRVMFDESLETDRLIADMNHEDALEGSQKLEEGPSVDFRAQDTGKEEKGAQRALKSIGADGEMLESNHDRQEGGKELAEMEREAQRVAMRYTQMAQQSHGQLRLANPRAIGAAFDLLTAGMSADQILDRAASILAERRARAAPAPQHLGDAGISVK